MQDAVLTHIRYACFPSGDLYNVDCCELPDRLFRCIHCLRQCHARCASSLCHFFRSHFFRRCSLVMGSQWTRAQHCALTVRSGIEMHTRTQPEKLCVKLPWHMDVLHDRQIAVVSLHTQAVTYNSHHRDDERPDPKTAWGFPRHVPAVLPAQIAICWRTNLR